jgi:YidC/Oxa1 family membrane protein insertase
VALIILYVGSQLVSGLITTVTADKSQRIMMLALPFLFVAFIINFEAGLIVYWITTNVWTIGQQLFVRKFMPKPDPIEPRTDGDSGKPARGKPPAPKPATGTAVAANGGKDGAGAKTPPPGPRKRKRRSGRRR